MGLILLWVSLGAIRMAGWAAHPDTALQRLVPAHPAPVQVVGVVMDDPAIVADGSGGSDEGQHATLALQAARWQDRWHALHGRVRLVLRGPHPVVRYGDEVLASGSWAHPPAAGNPGQYDVRAALARQRVHAVFDVGPAEALIVRRRGRGSVLRLAVSRVRHQAEQWLRARFSPRDAGLLLGLLLGSRAELDDAVREGFQVTGTMHLLVISGSHVGLIAVGLELLLRLCGIPWRARLFATALGLGGYCLLTGLSPPVLRATAMGWALLAALALDRAILWGNVLAAAALILLWMNPAQLFDPSFQLSFGAVWSLIALAPSVTRALARGIAWLRPAGLRRALALCAGATTAVWIGLLPLLAWYFSLVAPIALPANVLVTPLISLAVMLGSGGVLLAAIAEPLATWTIAPLHAVLELTLRVVGACQALPGGWWVVGRPAPGWCVAYYGALASGIWLRGRAVPARRIGWLAAALLIGATVVWAGHRAWTSRWLRVDVIDVGHGDSILVRAGGAAVLIDAGTEAAGRWRVVPFLRHEGVGRLEAVIVTHPDADHVGGVVPVLRAVRVGRVLTNGTADDTMAVRRVHEALRARRIPQHTVHAGMSWRYGDVTVDVLHPPASLVAGVESHANDNSIVVRVTKGQIRMVLTGDLEEFGAPVLLAAGRALSADVLQIPHHGSRLGPWTAALLDAVRPRVALLSAGRRPGLPAAATLDVYARRRVPVLSTAADGAIHLRTDGRRLDIRTHRGGRRMRLAR